jgi:hypothetical protein
MIVYQTNSYGVFVGPVQADPSPLEPGVWLIPGGCVETPPPAIPEGHVAVWQSGSWATLPAPEEEGVAPQPALTPEEILAAERAAMRLSFAQLLIGLVTEAWITEAEGEAWLIGTLPFAVLLVIDSLPAEQRFAAKARALRPSEVLRNDPLVTAMGTAAGKTTAEIDTFFQTYAGV